ncbi:hypothetical protein [Streptomyces sp. 11x1]|nr:hypothetical protein [Streptomyces sp. 11x1]WNZ14868.1 hypothetical protein P8T65_44015 [Streptomyces sp. 11x1]
MGKDTPALYPRRSLPITYEGAAMTVTTTGTGTAAEVELTIGGMTCASP